MLAEMAATVAAVELAVYLLDGVTSPDWIAALVAGGAMALAYLLIRPVARVLTKPLGCITFGLIGMIVDTALVMACTYFLPQYLVVASVVYAAGTALLINVCRGAARLLFPKD